jgi:hypothetical protein
MSNLRLSWATLLPFLDTVLATKLHLRSTEWDDAFADPLSDEFDELASLIQNQVSKSH